MPRCRLAWGNDTDATEAGACALILAAVEAAAGMVAVRRAETRSGADYYVAPASVSADDLEHCYRLEILGVDGGPVRDVYGRVRVKIEQVLRGEGNLPAIVGVTGFRSRTIVLHTVEGAE